MSVSIPTQSPGEFFSVIPAGGSGTRLWPLSRSQEPKFLLDLLGSGQSLLVDTVQRLEPFSTVDRVFVVTGGNHQEAVRKQVPSLPGQNVLVEPSPKNSAAAVGLAAFVLNHSNPDAVVGFFAADHVVAEEKAFQKVLATAIDAAKTGSLVTIGIAPTEPSSAFGYIKKGPALADHDDTHRVEEFVEKPSFLDAQRFVASENYLWNAGIFVGTVSAVVAAFLEFSPELGEPLSLIAQKLIAGEDFSPEWDALPAIAFDYAVAEPAAKQGRFLVVPGSFGWRDVGDFASLAQAQSAKQSSDVIVVGDAAKVHPHDSTGIVVGSSGRIITLLGVSDIVVVDTPDALLVTTKEHAQDVKQIVDHMKEQGLDDLL
ncbi:sugar phosphate nucleotidyltransferase [Pontimonas sp.]|nr:mannose-1-phosphate guanylyltransferase [Pontimonas sp.]MDA9116808.1 sugar phosphate nucleotidyltransferase [Pontimonas sp.]